MARNGKTMAELEAQALRIQNQLIKRRDNGQNPEQAADRYWKVDDIMGRYRQNAY